MRGSHEQDDPDRRGGSRPQQVGRVDVQPPCVPRPQVHRDRDRRRGEQQEHGRGPLRRHDRSDVGRQELHQRALQLEGGRLHRVQQVGMRTKAGTRQDGVVGQVERLFHDIYRLSKRCGLVGSKDGSQSKGCGFESNHRYTRCVKATQV